MVMAALSPIVIGFGLVLLIACANVANMMLARAMARQREMGVRLAMGAARSRLIRQLLTESVLLALPAAIAGYGISRLATEWGVRLMFATLPRGYLDYVPMLTLQPDARVFGFMLAASVVFGLALWPCPRHAGDAFQRDAGCPRRIHNRLPARAAARCARDRSGDGVRPAADLCGGAAARQQSLAGARCRPADAGVGGDRNQRQLSRPDESGSGLGPGRASPSPRASKVPFEGSLPRVPVLPEHARSPSPRATCTSRPSTSRSSSCPFCAAVTLPAMKPGRAPRWR